MIISAIDASLPVFGRELLDISFRNRNKIKNIYSGSH